MTKHFLMGNQACAHGALDSGVRLVCGYPGTPSTEVLETIAKEVSLLANSEEWLAGFCLDTGDDRATRNASLPHVEWSVNEKTALEIAAGCSFSGGRALVCMKQVGLNVACDPLMTLAYLGCKAGLVLYVADDPGPISSQTEQDTRQFAQFAHIPVLDPATPEETYLLVKAAFELSEKYETAVIVRSTTRICHGSSLVELDNENRLEALRQSISGFSRSPKWVTFPPLAYSAHLKMPERLANIAAEAELGDNQLAKTQVLCEYRNHTLSKVQSDESRKGIAAGGISWAYLLDALNEFPELESIRLFKIGVPFPFPDRLAISFLQGLDQVIVFEELEPVIERELLRVAGAARISVSILGKLTSDTLIAGENSIETIVTQLVKTFGFEHPAFSPETLTDDVRDLVRESPNSISIAKGSSAQMQTLVPRPPVLCAGCPHRASFLAVKQAVKGRKATFSGDIGCYTLGNSLPLDMVDTCLCMGAGFTIPQGMYWAEPDVLRLGFVGDSTFFASGITGVINAVYNQAPVTLIVLDNSITAMTGGQQHPGTGIRMSWDAGSDDITNAISIPDILKAVGVKHVVVQDPFLFEQAKSVVSEAIDYPGVSAVVFKSPCIALSKPGESPAIQTKNCTMCRRCIHVLGCPALIERDNRIDINKTLCNGCNLCVQICPFDALKNATSSDTYHNEQSE